MKKQDQRNDYKRKAMVHNFHIDIKGNHQIQKHCGKYGILCIIFVVSFHLILFFIQLISFDPTLFFSLPFIRYLRTLPLRSLVPGTTSPFKTRE